MCCCVMALRLSLASYIILALNLSYQCDIEESKDDSGMAWLGHCTPYSLNYTKIYNLKLLSVAMSSEVDLVNLDLAAS